MSDVQTAAAPPSAVQPTREEMRANIMKLEACMMAMPEHQVQIETAHYFSKGIYLRQIFIPKGVTLTGKIHKTEHQCILSLGEVSVFTDEGMKRLKASTVIKSLPGMKRVLFAHEDSVWINVHHNPTNETDLDKIDEIYIAKTFEEALGQPAPKPQIEGDK